MDFPNLYFTSYYGDFLIFLKFKKTLIENKSTCDICKQILINLIMQILVFSMQYICKELMLDITPSVYYDLVILMSMLILMSHEIADRHGIIYM